LPDGLMRISNLAKYTDIDINSTVKTTQASPK
jgi:hypothetical protein